MKKILELDNFDTFDKNDIYSIIISSVQSSELANCGLKELLNGISIENCWKIGYLHKEKDNINDYDMKTAFIYYVLTQLRFMPDDKWTPKMPMVSKYPKGKNITINMLYQMFGKKKE